MKFFRQKHPSKAELLDYAASLAGRAPLAASIGAHLTACKRCAAEVDAMRASLSFVAGAPALDASKKLTSRILVAARRERPASVRPLRRLWNPRRAAGMVAYAAVAACVAVLAAAPVLLGYTGTGFGNVRGASVAQNNAAPIVLDAAQMPAPTDLLAIASEVEALARAVRSSFSSTQDPAERIHQRAVSTMEAELSAAWAALERNPGCTQATQLVQSNLKRQAEKLRTLYAERGL